MNHRTTLLIENSTSISHNVRPSVYLGKAVESGWNTSSQKFRTFFWWFVKKIFIAALLATHQMHSSFNNRNIFPTYNDDTNYCIYLVLEMLNTLIGQTVKNMSKMERTKFETLITVHMHQRDIFDMLVRQNIKVFMFLDSVNLNNWPLSQDAG